MGNIFFMEWESKMIVWIQSHMSPFLLALESLFSVFGESIVLVVLICFIYLGIDKKKGIDIGINMMAILVFPAMLKNVALRLRPYMAQPDKIQCLKPVDADADVMSISKQGYSFPSMHSASSCVGYGSIAKTWKKKWPTAFTVFIVFTIGLSRVSLGNHYPTDVLAGWAMGALVLFGIPFLRKWLKKDSILFLILVLLGLPGVFFCKSTDYFTSYGIMIGLFAAVLFEGKYVHFENNKKIVFIFLRILIGGTLFFGLNKLLELPFSASFLESETKAAFLVRTARYAIVSFVTLGVYPLLFRLEKKIHIFQKSS